MSITELLRVMLLRGPADAGGRPARRRPDERAGRHHHQPRDVASVGHRGMPELRLGPAWGVVERVHPEVWTEAKPRELPLEMRPEDRPGDREIAGPACPLARSGARSTDRPPRCRSP